jgi:hypothetical protein
VWRNRYGKRQEGNADAHPEQERQLAIPLMQLEGIQVDEETQQAIEDWHYWVNQGYEF